MFDTILAFLKPYLWWIVGAGVAVVAGAFTWMTVDLMLTKSALDVSRSETKAANAIIEGQERAIRALDRVDALEEQIDRVLASNNQLIMQAQGANNEVPPEVAAAFITSSDSVLAYRGNPRAAEELRLPR